MCIKVWTIAVTILVCGIVFVWEAVVFYLRGVYTLRFKGTPRREYVHRSDRLDVYWLYMLLHVCAGTAAIFFSFWFLQRDPTLEG